MPYPTALALGICAAAPRAETISAATRARLRRVVIGQLPTSRLMSRCVVTTTACLGETLTTPLEFTAPVKSRVTLVPNNFWSSACVKLMLGELDPAKRGRVLLIGAPTTHGAVWSVSY